MVLSCQNVNKAFHEKQVFRNCSFHIEDYEKAAVVGINGAGKTTLLRIIVGELEADSGQVVFGKDKSFGYLPQNAEVDSEHTIYDELLEVKRDVIALEERIRQCELEMKHVEGEALAALMEQYALYTHHFELADGYSYRSEIVGVLKGLGFTEEEFSKKACTLSGGQKTRVALGKLLLDRPDLIILDEPTNHLDELAKEALKEALVKYEGTVILVSHEERFYRDWTDKVISMEK